MLIPSFTICLVAVVANKVSYIIIGILGVTNRPIIYTVAGHTPHQVGLCGFRIRTVQYSERGRG